jgi:hypothetical protein
MTTRRLSAVERDEASLVFGSGLDLDRIRIHEGVRWTTTLARWHARLRGEPPPAANAITLGFDVNIPTTLEISRVHIDAGDLNDMAWLIHELTHAWQFQHVGWAYLAQALSVQARLGPRAYDYGGEAGLRAARAAGNGWAKFNREQQGDIARDFYFNLKRGRDTSAWLPFITELRAA